MKFLIHFPLSTLFLWIGSNLGDRVDYINYVEEVCLMKEEMDGMCKSICKLEYFGVLNGNNEGKLRDVEGMGVHLGFIYNDSDYLQGVEMARNVTQQCKDKYEAARNKRCNDWAEFYTCVENIVEDEDEPEGKRQRCSSGSGIPNPATSLHWSLRFERSDSAWPYMYDTCGKGFDTQDKLKRHTQIHLNIKPYQCEICGNSFAVKNYLYIHKRLSHQNRPFASTNKKRRPRPNASAKFSRRKAVMNGSISQVKVMPMEECPSRVSDWTLANLSVPKLNGDEETREHNDILTESPKVD